MDNAATVDKDTFEEIMENVRARIRKGQTFGFQNAFYLPWLKGGGGGCCHLVVGGCVYTHINDKLILT